MLRVLGNEYRLLILCHLLDGEHQVGELQAKIDLSQSALSQHLARLRHEGVVKTRRQSQAIYYSLAGEEVKRILQVLHELYCSTVDCPQGRGITKSAVNY
jgi:DNA-binding transcriptional ArsR family regulator